MIIQQVVWDTDVTIDKAINADQLIIDVAPNAYNPHPEDRYRLVSGALSVVRDGATGRLVSAQLTQVDHHGRQHKDIFNVGRAGAEAFEEDVLKRIYAVGTFAHGSKVIDIVMAR